MTTCAEAYHFLQACGLKRLDADDDGIPCETLCGKTLASMQARLRAQPFVPQVNVGTANSLVSTAPDATSFSCGAKKTCQEMASCDEAKHHFSRCGLKALDRDGDGVPCNGLCRN